MKKILIITAGIMLSGLVHANLVVNGSFEQGTVGVYSGTDLPKSDSVIPGWRIYDTSKAAVTYELVADAAEATDGSNYIKITSTTTAIGPDAALDITQKGLGAVEAAVGISYKVSFDAKRVDGTDNNLALTIRTFEGGAIVEDLFTSGLPLTSDWATYSYVVKPTLLTSGGAAPVFYIGFRPKGSHLLDETICIDNVSIEAAPEPRSLVNGSFEEGTVGELSMPSYAVTGWRAFDTTGNNSMELVSDAAGASEGINYVKITSVFTDSGDTGYDVTTTGAGKCLISTDINYRVLFDAKWVSGQDNSLNIQVKTFEEGTANPILEDALVAETITLNTAWTTYSYDFSPSVQPVDIANGITLYIGFRPKNGGTLQNEVLCIDNVQLIDLTTGPYEIWTDTYPTLGTATNYTDDLDVDGMNNLLEYAVGGNPAVSDASSVQPSSVMESGWLYYVYKQRKNYEASGLDYHVFSGTELDPALLTNDTSVIGSGEYDSDFNLVTNGITADAPKAFMQLQVQKTD